MSRKNKKDKGGEETVLEPPMPEAKASVDESQEAEVAEAMDDESEWSMDDPRRPEWPEDGYVVAPGKAICIGKRILGEGESVEPNDLCADPDVAAASFDRLLDRGHIVEAMPQEAE